jgi:Spy/CpxP family protein refolding chaperone
MNVKKWLGAMMAATVVLAGLTVALKVRAEGAAVRRGMGGQFLSKAKEKLGLTDEQITKIKAELLAEKETLKPLVSSLYDTKIGLREAIQKKGASESEIRAASAKVAAVEADLAVERAKLFGKLSSILTADQLAKIDEFQEKMDDFVDGAISLFFARLAQ